MATLGQSVLQSHSVFHSYAVVALLLFMWNTNRVGGKVLACMTAEYSYPFHTVCETLCLLVCWFVSLLTVAVHVKHQSCMWQSSCLYDSWVLIPVDMSVRPTTAIDSHNFEFDLCLWSKENEYKLVRTTIILKPQLFYSMFSGLTGTSESLRDVIGPRQSADSAVIMF